MKSSAEGHMKNRPREKRERRGRQFVGVERRRESLHNAKAWWRVRETSGPYSDGAPPSYRRSSRPVTFGVVE